LGVVARKFTIMQVEMINYLTRDVLARFDYLERRDDIVVVGGARL
jgi:hypothetical protein